MNEIQDYGPETYHSAQTNSVFATLEGSRLRLDTPQSNISRRAACEERINESTFTKTRTYQLEQSKVGKYYLNDLGIKPKVKHFPF